MFTRSLLQALSLFALVAACGGGPSSAPPDGADGNHQKADGPISRPEAGTPATDGGILIPDRHAYDGQTPDGHAYDGQTADGHAYDGQTPDGRAYDGQAPDGPAAQGCAAGCIKPVAPRCGDKDTLWIFNSTGTCIDDACVFGYREQSCPNGCKDGACQGPLCGGVLCNHPPKDSCSSSSTRLKHATLGSCEADACVYQKMRVDCSEGCFEGACLPGSRTQEFIPSASKWASSARMAVDAFGKTHILVCQNSNVFYRHETAEGWKQESIDPGMGADCRVAIALDGRGTAHFAYYDSVHKDVRYAQWDGAAIKRELVETAGDVGTGLTMVLNADGLPQVAYLRQLSTTRELVVASRNASGKWQPQTVSKVSATAASTEFAASPDGHLHLLVGPSLQYLRYEGGAWAEQSLPKDATQLPRSLGLSHRGEVRLIYSTAEGGYLRRYGSGPAADQQIWDATATLDPVTPRLLVDAYDGRRMLLSDRTMLYRTDLGFWIRERPPLFPNATEATMLDWLLGPDGRWRLLLSYSHDNWAVVTSPPRTSTCGTNSCGSDGWGGDCGTCGGSTVCGEGGQCTQWRLSNIDQAEQPFRYGALQFVNNEVHAFSGAEHLRLSGGAWKNIPTPFSGAPSATFVDGKGKLHAAWVDTQRTLHLGVFESGAWTDVNTRMPGAPADIKLHVDDAGAYHVFHGRLDQNLNIDTQYTRFDSIKGAGVTETLWWDTPHALRVHRDAKGFFHIVSGGYASRLVYGTNAAGKWESTELEARYGSLAPNEIQLLADSTGAMHLSYWHAPSNKVIYRNKAGSAPWSREELPGAGPPAMAINSKDELLLVRNSTLWRRVKGNRQEDSLPLALPPEGVSSPIIAYDTDDKLHMIYSVGGELGKVHTVYGTH